MRLQNLPYHILAEIILFAGVNVTVILGNGSLLQNLNLAVSQVIKRKKVWTYKNMESKVDKILYWKWLDEVISDLKSVEEVQIFCDYCVGENIEVELKLCYELEYATDLVELEQLLHYLQPTAKLRLEISLATCRLNFLDLTQIRASFKHLRNHMKEFSITGAPMTEVKGEIDLNDFAETEVLRITRCRITGSLANCNKLREFSFEPIRGQANALDINDLPSTLKNLEINEYTFSDTAAKQRDNWPSLEHVSISLDEDPLPPAILDILQKMTCKETMSFDYSYEFGLTDLFVLALSQTTREKEFKLKLLSVYGFVEVPMDIYPSEQLQLRYIDSPHLVSYLKNIPYLKKLSITENYGLDVAEISKALPRGLEYLSLFDCEGSWDNADLNFARFPKLKHLNLARTGVSSISELAFPDLLEVLDLSGNGIDSIDSVVFPENLKCLNLSLNEIEDVQGVKFPQSLKRVNMSGNPVDPGSLMAKLESYRVEKMYLGGQTEVDLSNCKLPASVRCLSLIRCSLLNCDFGDNLVSLRLESCKLATGNSFGGSIRYLSIKFDQSPQLGIDLPQSLEELDLSHNAFTKVPLQVGNLPNLRYLNLKNNELTSAIIEFSYKSLEALDLSDNKIEHVQLSFPEGSTNLRQLDLCDNNLKSISLQMIGHDGDTTHNCLHELSVSGNLELAQNHIKSLIPQLPKSTKCLWADKSASERLRLKFFAVNYLIE